MRLWFFHVDEEFCDACAEQAPVIREFEKKQKRKRKGRIEVVWFNMMEREWPHDAPCDQPETTPGLLFENPPKPIRTLSGRTISLQKGRGIWEGDPFLTLEELETWIDGKNPFPEPLL